MNNIKKALGLLWMIAGPVLVFFLVYSAISFIDPNGKKEINNPVIWVIIILIFMPIAIGLSIFGWYAWRNEYEHLPEESSEL